MMNKMNKTFQIKSAVADKKNGVIIEGYANYNKMDRVKERMDPKTVKLENFKKNPILLFNHDMDYPVGSVLDLEPRDDGLYVKARVSGANESKLNYIRALVLEGVLKAFSIRYDVEDYSKSFKEDPNNSDCKLITDWELQELSIVSIPCQQDSIFELSGVKSLGEARNMALNLKGASAAAMINKAIDIAVKAGSEKGDIIQKISKISGLELGEISEALAGNMTPLPDQFKEACIDILEIESNELSEADASDVEKQKSQQEDAEKTAEGKESCDKMEDEEEEDGKEKAEKPEDDKEEEESKEKAIEPAIHENPMIERLDSLVALMGTMVNKFDMVLQSMEGMGKTEKLEYEDVEEKEEEKLEDEKAGTDEEMKEELAEDLEQLAEEELSDEEKEKLEMEEEKKGLDSLRKKYEEKCKKLGLNIDELLKV